MGCCTWTCGEYGNACCNDFTCGCGAACDPPACDYQPTGTDADADGYDAECEDCDDNNSLVNPSSGNEYCDCDASTPADHPSTKGISELTDCHLDEDGRHFEAGCLCLDRKDNDCDGFVDFADSDCPDLGHDLVIDTSVTLDESKDISPNGLYVMSGAILTVKSGVIITVGKAKGVHVYHGDNPGKIILEEDAHIKLK